MRKRLLCLFVILICFGIVTGFSVIKTESEETGSIQYEYDELNRVIRAEYPDGTTVTYRYDKNGNLLETIVTPPEEKTDSTTGEADTTEEMISDTEIPEQEMINQEYAFIRGNEMFSITNGVQTEENLFNQDKKTENGIIGFEADGALDAILNNKNQAAGEGSGTIPAEGNKSHLGWMLAVVMAIVLTAGIVWRIRRRKQDEN